MPKDSLVAELMSGPIKRKKRNTSLHPPPKIEDYQRPHIIKLCGGEVKSYPRTHLALNNNNDLTLPHHKSSPCHHFHFNSCHELSYATSLVWTMYIVIKYIIKWKSKGYT